MSLSLWGTDPLPFDGALRREIHQTFYNTRTGEISPQKISDYRSKIEQRYRDIKRNFEKYYHELLNLKKDRAKKKGREKNEIQHYRILLDYIDQLQQLAETATAGAETQLQFKRIALKVLEMDYALKVEGKKLPVTMLFEKVPASLRKWKIPIHDVPEGEAANLYDPKTGGFYSQAELETLKKNGDDISRLNPPPDSTFWTQHAISQIDVRDFYTNGKDALHEGITIVFPEKKGYYKKIRRTQTKPKMDITSTLSGRSLTFKLKIGAEVHSEITCAALYAALGFSVDISRYVRDFKVILGETTHLQFRRDWESYFSRYDLDTFVKKMGSDADGNYVIFHEGVLEAKPEELLRIGPWAYGRHGRRGRREVRASLLFNMWVANLDLKEAENNKLILRETDAGYRFFHIQHDMGFAFGDTYIERPGSFGWDLVKKKTRQHIHMRYRCFQKNSGFKHVTYADARWMIRLIARLNRQQIRAAMDLGGWPEAPAQLLTEKLISRRNQLVEAFGLLGEKTPDGDTIALIPFDRKLTTPDNAVVNGKLKTYRYPGYPQYFGPRLQELIGILLASTRNIAVDSVVQLTGSIKYISIDPEWFGWDKNIVTKIILRMGREIEPNPNPTSERDAYLVKDFVEVGFRLGYGFTVSGELTYVKAFTLVYPVRNRDDGRFHNGFIFNALLPFKTKSSNLPPDHVLLMEDYLKGGGRFKLRGDNLTITSHLTASKIDLRRRFISIKQNDKAVFFEDKSFFNELAIKVYFELAHLFRFPIFKKQFQLGTLTRNLIELDLTDQETNPQKQAALSQLILEGNAKPMLQLGTRSIIEDTFQQRQRTFTLFGFIKNRAISRFDQLKEKVVVRDGKPPAVHEKDIPFEKRYQVESQRLRSWQFMGNGERHFSTIRFTAGHSQAENDRCLERPLLSVQIQVNDKSTHNNELKNGYIRFINRMALKDNFIGFDPSEHTVNGLWGNTQTFIRILLYEKGIHQLVNASPDAVWAALSLETGKSVQYWKTLGKQKMYRGIPTHADYSHDRYLARKTVYFIEALQTAAQTRNPTKKMRAVVRAVRKSIYISGQTYNPVHLAVIHRLVSKKNLYISALITMPENKENVLPGRLPLFNEMGKDLGLRPPIYRFIFDDPSDIYHLY